MSRHDDYNPGERYPPILEHDEDWQREPRRIQCQCWDLPRGYSVCPGPENCPMVEQEQEDEE
jgi:hypothetical protein